MRFPDIARSDSEGPKLVAGMLTVIPYVIDNHNNLNFFDGIVKTNAELSVEPPPLDVFDMSSSLV